MTANTSIEWAHHTFNPWWGCRKVSAGCANCYAEVLDRRFGGGNWSGAHRFFGEKHWREPLKWNWDAYVMETRARVFCASMADVFEDSRDLDAHRERLFRLVRETPHLDWLLLTKRPENVLQFQHAWWDLANVWLGTSVEDQATADERIPHLLRVPARVRFLSCEPLLESLDLIGKDAQSGVLHTYDSERGVDWVIVGGESGPHARPCRAGWIRSIVRQCKDAEVPVFCKQLGARVLDGVPNMWPEVTLYCDIGEGFRMSLRNPKGSDPSEWPEDMRVREVPK